MVRKATELSPEAIREIVLALGADTETKRGMFARYRADPWNLSSDTIYRIGRANGWDSGRKTRCDKGQIRLEGVDEALIELAVKIILGGTRPALGKRLMPTELLLEQLALNGFPAMANVSISTFNRWLRERGLTHERLLADTAAVPMASSYPNHIHFVDASVCVQWDFNGRKNLVPRNLETEYYKNKPHNLRKIKKSLIRWLVVDHCSGAFYVNYTYASGENSKDLLDTLLDAWGTKPAIEHKYPLHGVPAMLGMDLGAANTSHMVTALLKKLGVKEYKHATGNARASGAVETVHNFWERNFESTLLLANADNLEELRARAHDFMLYLNAKRVHGRHGKTRSLKWREILPEQLRLLPPKDHCRLLARSAPQARTADNCLRISVDNIDYQLSGPAVPRHKVWFDYAPWRPGELNVYTEKGEPVPCRRIVKDRHGFDSQASKFGDDEYTRHADMPAQQLRKAFESEDKHTRLGGFEPKPMAGLVPDIRFLPPAGREIVIDPLPPAPPVKASEVAGLVRRALGITRITPEMNTALQAMLGGRDLVTPAELDDLITWARTAWAEQIPAARSEPFATPINLNSQEA